MKEKWVGIGLMCLLAAAACSKAGSGRGLQVTLQVMIDDVVSVYTEDFVFELKDNLKVRGLAVGSIRSGTLGQFAIEGYGPGDEQAIMSELAERGPDWSASAAGGVITAGLKSEVSRSLRDAALEQTVQVLHKRLENFGVSDPEFEKLPKARLSIGLRGVEGDVDRLLGIMTTSAFLELKLVQAGPAMDETSLLVPTGGRLPDGLQVVPADPRRMEAGYFLVNRAAGVTGRDIVSAEAARDDYDRPSVGFKLSADGSRRFAALTGENIGRQLAIVLDGRVQSAPVVQSVIEDRGVITGRFTAAEVEDLAMVLRSGGLPARVTIVESREY